MFLHNLAWQRRDQPILSAMTTTQDWCRVQLYNPTVVHHDNTWRMWYLGNSTRTRTNDMNLGLATSSDGIHWEPHPANPILTADDLPNGGAWQTLHALFDEEADRYRMWFVMSDSARDASGKACRMDKRPCR